MNTKINIIIKRIQKQQDRIANERNKLDALISELDQLRDDCVEAWDNLQGAIDALSRTQ